MQVVKKIDIEWNCPNCKRDMVSFFDNDNKPIDGKYKDICSHCGSTISLLELK